MMEPTGETRNEAAFKRLARLRFASIACLVLAVLSIPLGSVLRRMFESGAKTGGASILFGFLTFVAGALGFGLMALSSPCGACEREALREGIYRNFFPKRCLHCGAPLRPRR